MVACVQMGEDSALQAYVRALVVQQTVARVRTSETQGNSLRDTNVLSALFALGEKMRA